jgi:hypothetical protein
MMGRLSTPMVRTHVSNEAVAAAAAAAAVDAADYLRPLC